MSDITCAVCSEPWDAYGVKHGDMESDEAVKFLAGKGCPSCGFGQKCTHCCGTGKEPEGLCVRSRCSVCCGQRYVRVWKEMTNAPYWKMGYTNVPEFPVRTLKEDPVKVWDRRIVTHKMGGYLVEGVEALATCPECYEQTEVCTVCNGTGKYVPREGQEERFEQFLWTGVDATDDPDTFLEGVLE